MFDLLYAIERHLTNQIDCFKSFFPCPPSRQQHSLNFITSSLKAVLLLCRMIDKNSFFRNALKDREENSSSSDSRNSTLSSNAHAEAFLSGGASAMAFADTKFPNDSSTPAAFYAPSAQHGPFSFKSKLSEILQSRAVLRYSQLSELATPMETGTLKAVISKASSLAQFMMDDVDEERKVYRPGFLDEMDLVPTSIETFLKLFILEMENMSMDVRAYFRVHKNSSSINGAPNNHPEEEEEEMLSVVFQLMDRVQKMQRQWTQYVPKLVFSSDATSWFSPFILRWLDLTEQKTLVWVDRAISADTFEPQHSHLNSSSAVDLLTAIFQELGFIQSVIGPWQNSYQLTSFMTRFSQITYRAIDQYCDRMDSSSTHPTNATTTSLRSLTSLGTGTANNSGVNLNSNDVKTMWTKWISATGAGNSNASNGSNTYVNGVGGSNTSLDIPIESQNIDTHWCVRLSNLETITTRLGELYSQMQATEINRISARYRQTRESSNLQILAPDSNISSPISGVFKVQIVCAENLRPPTSLMGIRCNPTASICHSNSSFDSNLQEPLAMTHVVHDSLNPHFSSLDPSIVLERHAAHDFLLPPEHAVFALQNVRSLDVLVHHKPAASALKFLSSSDKALLGHGTFRIASINLVPNQRAAPVWVPLEPQGRVLLRVEWLVEGLNVGSLNDDIALGVAAVQDVDFWFMKMNARIGATRESFVRRILQQMYAIPLHITAIVKKSRSLPDDSVVSMAVADVALTPIVDYLNTSLSLLSSNLSDSQAQYIAYQCWMYCILGPMVYQLTPITFHGSSDIGAMSIFAGTSSANGDPAAFNLHRAKLNGVQVEMLKHCLGLLARFFHADGEGLGLPSDILFHGCAWYRDLALLLEIYNEPPEIVLQELERTQRWSLLKLLRLWCAAGVVPRELVAAWVAKRDSITNEIIL